MIDSEATITINGHLLTLGQSATIRIALESVSMDLGDDDHGKKMSELYQARIREIAAIRKSLYKKFPPSPAALAAVKDKYRIEGNDKLLHNGSGEWMRFADSATEAEQMLWAALEELEAERKATRQ